MLRLGEYIYVDRPPSLKANKEKGDETKSNLLPKTVGNFQIFATPLHKVIMDEEGIPKTVIIGVVVPAMSQKDLQENGKIPSEHKETHERDDSKPKEPAIREK